MNNKKLFTAITVLILTMIYCFLFPKIKYVSTNILSQLRIPLTIANWQGTDVAKKINTEDLRYNFISNIFTRVYQNPSGENLLFLMLDAGNFHNPKACFGGSGYKIKELNDINLNPGHPVKVHSLYTEKGDEKYLIVYWICIDKEITDWTGQKFKELWYSLFNKKKTGLMVRLDIPVKNGNIENSITLGKNFIKDLGQILPAEQADNLFGK